MRVGVIALALYTVSGVSSAPIPEHASRTRDNIDAESTAELERRGGRFSLAADKFDEALNESTAADRKIYLTALGSLALGAMLYARHRNNKKQESIMKKCQGSGDCLEPIAFPRYSLSPSLAASKPNATEQHAAAIKNCGSSGICLESVQNFPRYTLPASFAAWKQSSNAQRGRQDSSTAPTTDTSSATQ